MIISAQKILDALEKELDKVVKDEEAFYEKVGKEACETFLKMMAAQVANQKFQSMIGVTAVPGEGMPGGKGKEWWK